MFKYLEPTPNPRPCARKNDLKQYGSARTPRFTEKSQTEKSKPRDKATRSQGEITGKPAQETPLSDR